MTVTVFPNIFETTRYTYANVEEVFKGIKDGGSIRKQVEQLRELMLIDPNRANEEKKKLPGICFGGEFTKRSNDSLVKASGLMILDFDHPDIEFQDKLLNDEYIYAYWVSPRGEGYKALVRIPVVNNDTEYKQYFFAFQKRYPEVDPSGKDIARVCYFSYDPSIVVKEDCKMWEEKAEVRGGSGMRPAQEKTKVKSDFKKIAIGIDMLRNAQTGNRHETILKAGRLMGGYIGSGEIDEFDVTSVFESEVMSIMDNPSDFRTQWKTFTDGILYGKADPIKAINEVKIEQKIGQIDYVLANGVREKLNKRYAEGKPKGYHVGFDSMRKLYKVVLGYMTFIYGAPFCGKTQFTMEMLVNLSEFYGMKHALFLPETGSADEIFEELVQIHARGDFGNERGKQITIEQRDASENFIEAHFIIIDPEDLDIDLTVKDLLDYVQLLERKWNTKIHTITIDPWNDLDHSEMDARDIYTEKQLKICRRYAKRNDWHIFISVHTKSQKPITRNGETYYPIPTPRDISWGEAWFRRGFMMLSFWRPSFYKQSSQTIKVFGRELRTNSTIIQVQKSKPKGVGSLGEIELFYDTYAHRYYDWDGSFAKKIDDDAEELKKVFVQVDDPDLIPF